MDYQKLVLDNIRDRLYVVRSDGEIVFATPSVKTLGYEVQEVVGRKIYELADDEYRERIIKTLKSLKEGVEAKIKVLVRRKDCKRVWSEVRGRKVGEYVIILGREISRLVSFETLLRATVDLLRNSPMEVDELENILRKYFDDAKFSKEIQELTIKVGEVIVPVRVQDKVMGSLVLSLPDWFEISDENLEFFDIIGECAAKNILIMESRKIIRSSLVAIKGASENLAIFIDRIRNSLAVINALAEIKVSGEVYEKVYEQVRSIEDTLTKLDDEWEKVDRLADELLKVFSSLERVDSAL